MRAHGPLCLRPFSAATGLCSQAAGLRGWHLPRQSAQHELGEKGPAGLRSKPRGARARRALRTWNRGARAPCLGQAPRWAGPGSALRGQRVSPHLRKRLPWVTRLRGDTVLPSPSGNLSIGEIDNPSAAPLTRFALPAAGRADLRWRHLLGGGSVGTPPQLRSGLGGWWRGLNGQFRGTASG